MKLRFPILLIHCLSLNAQKLKHSKSNLKQVSLTEHIFQEEEENNSHSNESEDSDFKTSLLETLVFNPIRFLNIGNIKYQMYGLGVKMYL